MDGAAACEPSEAELAADAAEELAEAADPRLEVDGLSCGPAILLILIGPDCSPRAFCRRADHDPGARCVFTIRSGTRALIPLRCAIR